MDMKNINTFIYTAELGSFTKAAELLGYSQSTVSFQIRQLEEELGTVLFERINRTVTLTDRGKEILRYAHRMKQLAGEMQEMVQPKRKCVDICGSPCRIRCARRLQKNCLFFCSGSTRRLR